MFISDGYHVRDAIYFWNDRDDNTSAVVIPNDLSFLQYEMTTLVLTEMNMTYNSGTSISMSWHDVLTCNVTDKRHGEQTNQQANKQTS